MGELFGYKNVQNSSSNYLSEIKPHFQPLIEHIEIDTAVFLGGNVPKQKNDFIFNSHELLIIIQGNIYFKKDFFRKYPKSKEFQYKGIAHLLANLYLHYGLNIISDLIGDFILVIKVEAEKKLLIIRDKVGGRKLYYTVVNDNLIFSSEIKGLLGLPNISRDVDYFGLESFMKFGYIMAPITIFKSIKELEPGHLLEVCRDGYKTERYWNLDACDEIKGNRTEISKKLYEKIEENISVRLKPKERVGIYLSRGMDSNTLFALMSKFINPSEIQTISLGYGEQYKDYHELNEARFSANYFGSNHHELIGGPEDIDKHLCKMVWQFEQPFGNPALISWVSLAELAKDLADVVFIGTGADEVLGGYRRYNALNFSKLYYKIPHITFINRILKSFLNSLPVGSNHYHPIYRCHKFVNAVRSDIFRTNDVLLFGDYEIIRRNLFVDNFFDIEEHREPSFDKLYEIGNTKFSFRKIFIADCYSDLMTAQVTRSLIPLDKYGVDYRAPFSDPDFMTFCLNIPEKYKANLFQTKIIYRDAMSKVLPGRILSQKKRGFSHPVSLWLEGPLYKVIKSILSSDIAPLGNYFNLDHLHGAAEEHHSKKRDWGNLLWKIIVFRMWHKLFIENRFSCMPDFDLRDIVSK
jgi:asparagine synthase (glutamine-hydrolysing)